MAYLAVNENGNEVMFKNEPYFDGRYGEWRDGKTYQYGIVLPKFSIIAITGKKITCEDEPIKI